MTKRPLDPKLPTDPRHYKDVCSTCQAAWPGMNVPSFAVVPLAYDENAGRWRYRCPMGHQWTCSYAQQVGYFSDCPCLFCYEARRDNGDRTYEGRPEYDRHSEAYRFLSSESRRSVA